MGTRVIQDSISIAANTVENNVLSGKTFERVPPEFGLVSLTLRETAEATGMQRELNVGGVIQLERGLVSAQNRVPIIDDLVAGGIDALSGELIQLRVENTTAGALTYFYTLVIEY